MDKSAMFKIGYGLYVLTTKDDNKQNGCIINTVMQVTDTPNRICLAVNKSNHTHNMLLENKCFNVSVLSEKASFDTFKHFGFQSGREVDKFKDYEHIKLAANDVYYITEGTNAYITGYVKETMDLGTHTLFIADVVNAVTLNDDASCTYNYYQKNIKPSNKTNEKKGWVCKICGYVYEGEELPEDFVCPLCKHGASDFEKLS